MLGGSALVLGAALLFAVAREDGMPADTPPAIAGAGDLEARVAADADDVEAWAELGRLRSDAGDRDGAVIAWRRAAELAPAVADHWSSLGEALVMAAPASGSALPPAALAAFRRAIAIEPSDPRARFFLAVEKDIAGDPGAAIDDWIDLLADTPHGAPWEADLRRTIEQVGARENIAVASRIVAARRQGADDAR